MSHDALMHSPEDDVAVVIHNVAAGDEVVVVLQNGRQTAVITAIEDIPLGHKIALRDKAAEERIIKYGRSIGRVTQAITTGAHVHTQNLKSVRWA
jgi:(2R)-sulfolactate sulfo-lyase subunit alpha